MSEKDDEGGMGKAGAAAKHAAYRARALADFLEAYADHLDDPSRRHEVSEMASFIEFKMDRLRATLADSNRLRHEGGGEAMSDEAGEYVLSFNVGGDPTPEIPATQRYGNLYEALATASIVRKYKGRSSQVLRGEKVEMDSGELEVAFARMDELEREDPGGDRQSWSRQVLREMGKEP